jgi:hypothetical protein
MPARDAHRNEIRIEFVETTLQRNAIAVGGDACINNGELQRPLYDGASELSDLRLLLTALLKDHERAEAASEALGQVTELDEELRNSTPRPAIVASLLNAIAATLTGVGEATSAVTRLGEVIARGIG